MKVFAGCQVLKGFINFMFKFFLKQMHLLQRKSNYQKCSKKLNTSFYYTSARSMKQQFLGIRNLLHNELQNIPLLYDCNLHAGIQDEWISRDLAVKGICPRE